MNLSFNSKLKSGKFVITAEVCPPKGTDISRMLKDADLLKDTVDAVNITDNQRAIMRMSPLAACSVLEKEGIETIMHVTCRDRNRLGLQSDLLGAHMLGIRNVLVMSGDHPAMGDHAGAKPVYDVDSVQLIGMIGKLNQGFDLAGNKLEMKTDFCVGAVTNPELNEPASIKLRKKIKMGAGFFQTQAVFHTGIFSGFMEKINEIQPQVKVLAGIMPLKSEKNAVYLNKIPGIRVPKDVIERLKRAKNAEEEGIRIAAEMIEELRHMCDGIHIMPLKNNNNTRKLLEMTGLI